ncbi:uncharacterized protein G2W53_016314 [Senna tora]|uniref:Uncharacterized protein n=1 Tax=Senna tora TaxID=362788 RepID=A0A834TNQ4_9FABA|nr:uncharacterized protein G2W53_016314 [Senna tora]
MRVVPFEDFSQLITMGEDIALFVVHQMPIETSPFSLDVPYVPLLSEYQKAIELLNVPTIPSTYSPSPLTSCIAIHPSISEPQLYTSNRVVNQVEGTRQKDA